ncbi:MAG TPA: hypothetical protein VKU85_19170 [bacterium]|nr:hypothetical protein [bacterium]
MIAQGRRAATRWQLRARRRIPTAGDEARWNLATGAGPGRLIVGSQLRLGPAPERRGWTRPLADRRAPAEPSPSLARTGTGLSWFVEGNRRLRLGAGRERGGDIVAQIAAGTGGWLAAGGIRGRTGLGLLAWDGTAGDVPAAVQLARDGRRGLVRAALGADPTAVLVEWDDRGAQPVRVVAVGIRVRGGRWSGLQLEAAVRDGPSRMRPYEVGWARRGDGWAARARVSGRASAPGTSWRLALERGVPGGGTVHLTLDGDAGLRPDAARWSWRLGGAGARASVTLELPARRPRAGWFSLSGPSGGGTRLAARGRWTVGRRAAFDLEWTWPLPGGRPRSTR